MQSITHVHAKMVRHLHTAPGMLAHSVAISLGSIRTTPFWVIGRLIYYLPRATRTWTHANTHAHRHTHTHSHSGSHSLTHTSCIRMTCVIKWPSSIISPEAMHRLTCINLPTPHRWRMSSSLCRVFVLCSRTVSRNPLLTTPCFRSLFTHVQYAAKNGYDCIWLDLEHRAMGQREVQAILQVRTLDQSTAFFCAFKPVLSFSMNTCELVSSLLRVQTPLLFF